MNLFSISQLAQFSGIKPHTIRVWEQRYHTLKPIRSEGNTRYYDNTQLRRLLNIVSLMESGYKISELSPLSDPSLFKLLDEQQKNNHTKWVGDYFVTQLIVAVMDYHEGYFEKIFSHCLLKYGMKDTYTKVIYPVMVRLGLIWTTGIAHPAHEHFNSNIIRQKLFTAIDSLPPWKTESDNWLLFLPENEFHEIGLLFAHYLIRESGRKSIYLGGNVPVSSLSAAIPDIEPDNLLLFLVHNDIPENSQHYLDGLNKTFSGIPLYISGNQKLIRQLKTDKKIHWLTSVEDLEQRLFTV